MHAIDMAQQTEDLPVGPCTYIFFVGRLESNCGFVLGITPSCQGNQIVKTVRENAHLHVQLH